MQVEQAAPWVPSEAAMQAVVSQRAVAVAVAGLLVEDIGNLRGHLVGGHLIGMSEVSAGELVAAQDGREGFGRRLRCRPGYRCGVAPLRGGCDSDQA